MTTDNKSIAVVRDIVSVIRTGGGILGKSAMLMALLIVCVFVAVFRVPPTEITQLIGLVAIIFFVWFAPILWLVNKYPEKAFLEGPQWSAHHQQELLAKKGQPLIPAELSRTSQAGIVLPHTDEKEGNQKS
ncbi:MAG: hypothetical protein WAN35_18850 [Terracidiphilus sp.]